MPSFTIEAPAEANPLTNEALYRVISRASSSDPTQIQTGTKQLQNWETLNGFYSGLQSLYLDVSLPVEVRYLAIIQLKNAVDKYWRKSAQRTLTKDEKDLIRSRCVEGVLNEPIPRLALQSAIFTSKILRSELPREWMSAVEVLVSRLRSISNEYSTSMQLPRLLLLLLYIVKELATARLAIYQRNLRSIAGNLCSAIYTVYSNLSKKWLDFLQFGGDDEGGALESMEASLLALRTLRRLLIVGFEHPNRVPTICEFWPNLINQMGRMLKLVAFESNLTLELQAGPRYLVERHLIQMAKVHLHMAKDHAAAFVLLPQSIELTKSYWAFIQHFGESYGRKQSKNLTVGADGDVTDEDEIAFREQFSLKGLLLIRACSKMVFNPAQSFKYQSGDDKDEKTQATEIMKNQILTEAFARQVLESLVSKFFVFTPRDLKQWEEEPDEWEKSQEGMGDDWEFSIRVCSEKLFLDMILNYKAELVPHLIQIIANAARSMSNNIWLKDSIYAAIGLAAPVLHDKFDFANFLSSTLVQEVQIQRPDYNVIRRRIAIVLGQWLPAKGGLDRPLVYQIFQHLLDKGDTLNDEVVRVTASRKLGDVIDPFDFVAQDFAPFAPTIIQRLLDLVQEAQLPETKLALMNTLHIIVVKMEGEISPFGDQILSLLPPLWDAAGDELLIKEMILSILTGLIASMKGESRRYHLTLVPLIISSTFTESSGETFLAEEALNLWSAILDETPTPAAPPIVQLFHNLLPMLEVVSEMLDRVLTILDAYIYLIPAEIVSNASIIFSKWVPIISGIRREPIGLISHSLDILFCSAQNLGGIHAVEHVVSALISTTFLSSIFTSLRDAYDAHQTTGPNGKQPAIDGVVETDFLGILARIAVASPELLLSTYEAVRAGSPIEWLFDEWFSHIDNISHADRKKLACLALTACLETAQPWILNKLQLFMTMWTSVLTELEDDCPNSNNSDAQIRRDCLVWSRETFPPPSEERISPSVERSREVCLADPVHVIETRDFIRQKLGVAIERVGGMERFREQWVGNVDKEVLEAFGGLGVF